MCRKTRAVLSQRPAQLRSALLVTGPRRRRAPRERMKLILVINNTYQAELAERIMCSTEKYLNRVNDKS